MDLKQISGEGNISEDAKELEAMENNQYKVYPVLRDGSWVGLQHNMFFHPIIGTKENPKVVQALAYDAPNNLIYVPNSENVRDLYFQAMENLENIDKQYTVFDYNGHFEVNASGHEFSSEFLLDDKFLLKLHDILKSDEILVAVPRRGHFKAIASTTSRDLQNGFIEEYESAYEHDLQKPQIANGVFIIKNGVIKQRGLLEKQ